MLLDAKRVLFTTAGDVEGGITGSWEKCGLTCLICVLGFFGLTNLHNVRVSVVLKVVICPSRKEVSLALALVAF